jgi:hypothetical protein
MKPKAVKRQVSAESGYSTILGDISALIAAARSAAARSVNSIMTATYWLIGRRIVQSEQKGEIRAKYGEELIERLAADLSVRFGRGFSIRNVWQMKAFYLAWPNLQTSSAEFGGNKILQTVSAESGKTSPLRVSEKLQPQSGKFSVTDIAQCFPLPWSAYVRLLAVKNENARRFYEAVARYALDNLPNKVLAAEYRTVLPDEKELAAEIERTRAALEQRKFSPRRHGRKSHEK